jgi:hypothetical protein
MFQDRLVATLVLRFHLVIVLNKLLEVVKML